MKTAAVLPALIDRSGLQAELGITEHAAETIMRRLDVIRPAGLRKVFVKREDVASYLKEATVEQQTADSVRASVSVWVRRREYASGRVSWIVMYRRGGRGTRQECANTFPTRRLANARADLVRGWLALGLDPQQELRKLLNPERQRSLADWFDDFTAARVDVSDSTITGYGNARDRLLPILGDIPVSELTAAHVQDWIGRCADLAPGTIHGYLSVLRLVLDHAEIEPNPARSRKVREPRDTSEEPTPPTSREWQLIQAAVDGEAATVLRLIECLGLRVSEATSLLEADVDWTGGKLRVSKARTKGRTAGQRWLRFPPELLQSLEGRQRDRRLFSVGTDRVRQALRLACQRAGVSHYHPHDLRHRRISLWFAHGFDDITISTWAGHAKRSMSKDRYGHVIAEPHLDEWRPFWLDAYRAERLERPGLAVAAALIGETE